MGVIKTEQFLWGNGVQGVRDFYGNGTIIERVLDEEPTPQPTEPTEAEMFQAELLLNQVVMLENQVAQDVVLAEILLGQQGL